MVKDKKGIITYGRNNYPYISKSVYSAMVTLFHLLKGDICHVYTHSKKNTEKQYNTVLKDYLKCEKEIELIEIEKYSMFNLQWKNQ